MRDAKGYGLAMEWATVVAAAVGAIAGLAGAWLQNYLGYRIRRNELQRSKGEELLNRIHSLQRWSDETIIDVENKKYPGTPLDAYHAVSLVSIYFPKRKEYGIALFEAAVYLRNVQGRAAAGKAYPPNEFHKAIQKEYMGGVGNLIKASWKLHDLIVEDVRKIDTPMYSRIFSKNRSAGD